MEFLAILIIQNYTAVISLSSYPTQYSTPKCRGSNNQMMWLHALIINAIFINISIVMAKSSSTCQINLIWSRCWSSSLLIIIFKYLIRLCCSANDFISKFSYRVSLQGDSWLNFFSIIIICFMIYALRLIL
jgi:hypothetical protein